MADDIPMLYQCTVCETCFDTLPELLRHADLAPSAITVERIDSHGNTDIMEFPADEIAMATSWVSGAMKARATRRIIIVWVARD
jgi:hypothetical protein